MAVAYRVPIWGDSLVNQPNVILIITDQQRYDTIGALGYEHAVTPNLDRLVEEGASLSGCHVAAPVCAPNRASLFSGMYPHNTGVLSNQGPWPPRTWIHELADAGYHCVNIGKMHTTPYETAQGFHERYIVENKDRDFDSIKYYDDWQRTMRSMGERIPSRDTYRDEHPDWQTGLGAFEWELAEHLHPDVFVANNVRWWLEQSDERYEESSKPLFLEIGFPGPHPPYDPIGRYLEMYEQVDIPMLDVTSDELAAQPEGLKLLRRAHRERNFDAVGFDPTAEHDRRLRQRRHYLANVTMIDELIGQILHGLRAKGILDDAVVVFTSDHGDNLGDHGLSQKWNMYDQSVRVPAIFWYPGRIQAGLTVDGLFQSMDIGETIRAVAGLEPHPFTEAKSLLPAFEADAREVGREYVFAELGRDAVMTEIDYTIMARNDTWKYVEFIGSDDGQLFHLPTDQEEVTNLWGEPDYRSVREEMRAVVHDWFVRSVLVGAQWHGYQRRTR